MKELQLVSFKQAQRLKAAGFDWEVYTIWFNHPEVSKCPHIRYKDDIMDWNNYTKFEYSAPTVALALKWMRDVHYLFGEVKIGNEPRGLFFFEVFSKNGEFLCGSYLEGDDFSGHYDTYEAAESALLNELFNVLETEKI